MKLEVRSLIFLIEIRLKYSEADKLKVSLGMQNRIMVYYERENNGKRGGLCLFWNKDWKVGL